LRRDWSLQGRFVVGYSGNLGRAHDYATVLAAAERLRDHPNIIFLFIGGGYQLKQLADQVRNRGLSNFRFFDYQDRALLKFSLGVPDVHWLSLRATVEGLIVPSKFYGIAAGRPTGHRHLRQRRRNRPIGREAPCGSSLSPVVTRSLPRRF
jgi:hypothetical protein